MLQEKALNDILFLTVEEKAVGDASWSDIPSPYGIEETVINDEARFTIYAEAARL